MDRFEISTTLIANESPQLNRKKRDLAEYVGQYVIQDEEAMIEICIKAENIEHEINIQRDITG